MMGDAWDNVTKNNQRLIDENRDAPGEPGIRARLMEFSNIHNMCDFIEAEAGRGSHPDQIIDAIAYILTLAMINSSGLRNVPMRAITEMMVKVHYEMARHRAGLIKVVGAAREVQTGHEREITAEGILNERPAAK